MKTKLIVVGGAIVLAGVAVLAAVRARTQPNIPATRAAASIAKDEKASASAPPQSVDLIPIVHLETRDKLVTVQSGPGGLVYLVQTKDGKVLHDNLSEDQLKLRRQKSHELIKNGRGGKRKQGQFVHGRADWPVGFP